MEIDPLHKVHDLGRRPAILRPRAEPVREERIHPRAAGAGRGTPATRPAAGPARPVAYRAARPRGRGSGRPGAREGRSTGRPRAAALRGTRGASRAAKGRAGPSSSRVCVGARLLHPLPRPWISVGTSSGTAVNTRNFPSSRRPRRRRQAGPGRSGRLRDTLRS